MNLEHTRTQGFDRSPSGTTWWTIEHNGKQYCVKQETRSNSVNGEYEFKIESTLLGDKVVKVEFLSNKAKVTCTECDFVDVTLAVQLASFIEYEVKGKQK